ncbi:MAG: ADP-glyceromanno-heptose 6-epimerase [Desulfovibrio sp.]|jgi:ADP-L-glycero-D-manno-heptose 6-epimerase|nr:ADP-glyceromanno-heptose 6-epimerase [Desulfovibrio sp.]
MIIVTGGAGFIGSAMIWKLNQMGVDDILVVDNLGSSEKWKNLVNLRYTDYLHRDQFLEMILEEGDPFGVEAVVHMGACSSTTEKNADFLMENNTRYTQAVCDYALKNGARLVNASSAATYGGGEQGFKDDHESLGLLKPLNMYGYSKHLFDLWARRTGALGSIACIKFFNVFGPNEYHKGDMRSVICKAYAQIQERGQMRLFRSYRKEYPDGGQMRDFVYIKDCVDILWWLMEHPEANGVINVGTGIARTWNDLANAVFAAMGRKPNIEYIEMPESIRDKYQYLTRAEMGKLRDMGYTAPFSTLEDAVKDYVTGYLAMDDPFLDARKA